MVKRSKVENLYSDLEKVEPEPKENKGKDNMIHANFYIRKEDLEKLRQYVKQVAPRHIKVSLSEMVRYMIGSFDLEKGKKEFFKVR